ncbi:hypothetical protein Hanom_Chr12g01170181 [Helianthus anomalus]
MILINSVTYSVRTQSYNDDDAYEFNPTCLTSSTGQTMSEYLNTNEYKFDF